MKETELAEIVINWLSSQHWDIYQEVEFRGIGGIADICAVRNGIIWIIETKMAFTIEVLNQASRWPVHYRSVAVPSVKRNTNRDYLVARDYYNVGVLDVSGNDVYEQLKPRLYLKHRKTAKYLLEQLTDLHRNFAKAGSKGNHLTPYKMTMINIRNEIEKNPGCTIKHLFDTLGKMHYSSKESFKGNILKCLESFEKDWCQIDYSAVPYKLYIRENAPARSKPEIDWFK